MKKNDFEDMYNVLSELITLRQISTKESKSLALDKVIWAFMCYVQQGHTMYLDNIILAIEECEHNINLPSPLNDHIDDYREHLVSAHEAYIESLHEL